MLFLLFRKTKEHFVGIYVITAVLVSMSSCIVRWHNIPDPADFQIIQRGQNEAIGLALLWLLALLVPPFVIGLIHQTIVGKRLTRERREWEKNHVHVWNGCVCEDKRCFQTLHELDSNCMCKNCGNSVHTTVDSSWDHGSTHVIEESCSRCGAIVSSQGYYAG